MRTASRQGLLAIFGSTLFQLTGIFMLSPLLLLLLRRAVTALLKHFAIVQR